MLVSKSKQQSLTIQLSNLALLKTKSYTENGEKWRKYNMKSAHNKHSETSILRCLKSENRKFLKSHKTIVLPAPNR